MALWSHYNGPNALQERVADPPRGFRGCGSGSVRCSRTSARTSSGQKALSVSYRVLPSSICDSRHGSDRRQTMQPVESSPSATPGPYSTLRKLAHISTVGWGESTPVFLHLASSHSRCPESKACFTSATWSSDTYVRPCGDLYLPIYPLCLVRLLFDGDGCCLRPRLTKDDTQGLEVGSAKPDHGWDRGVRKRSRRENEAMCYSSHLGREPGQDSGRRPGAHLRLPWFTELLLGRRSAS